MNRKEYNSTTWFELRCRMSAHAKASRTKDSNHYSMFRRLYWVTMLGYADPKYTKKKTIDDFFPMPDYSKNIIRKTKATPSIIPLWKDKERLKALHARFNPINVN